MIHSKDFEEKALEYIRPQFDEVIWLSKTSLSPIDFKCRKGEQWFMVEAKQNTHQRKARLLPSQKNVDAVVMLIDGEMKLIWRKDFYDNVTIDKVTLIKISSSLKEKLNKLRLVKRESYNDILERLLELPDED